MWNQNHICFANTNLISYGVRNKIELINNLNKKKERNTDSTVKPITSISEWDPLDDNFP